MEKRPLGLERKGNVRRPPPEQTSLVFQIVGALAFAVNFYVTVHGSKRLVFLMENR